MKSMNAINRTALYLNAALVVLALALLAGASAKAVARDDHARIVHSTPKSSLAHSLNRPGGQKVIYWWWLRRW